MLVEDDETVNFYNEFLLNELNAAEEIVIKTNGREALEFLTQRLDGGDRLPDLIFLDINMPVMNGFEFLEAYERQFGNSQQAKALIVMLTTSLHPTDLERAKNFGSVSDYIYKPLMEEKLSEILTRYF